MLRRFWILLAFLIAAFAGYQGYAHAPGLIAWLQISVLGGAEDGALAAASYVGGVFALSLGLAILFALVFVTMAGLDWLRTRRALAGIAWLRESQQSGLQPDHRKFLEAFGEIDEIVHIAADYAATLHGERGRTAAQQRYRATVPASTFFNARALVDSRLLSRFFRRLPAILYGVGVLGLAFGLLSGLGGIPTSGAFDQSALVPLIDGARGGLMALSIAIAFAVIIGLVHHSVVAVRHQQIDDLCQMIDGLFAPGVETEYLRTIITHLRSEGDETRRAIGSLSESLTTDRAHLGKAISTQNRDMAGEISAAVRKSLAGPMKSIADANMHANRSQSEQVKDLMSGALNAFMIELESRFGDQLGKVDDVLVESTAAAADLRDSFNEAADHLSDALSQQAEAFARQLEAALGATSDRHADDNKELAVQLEKLSDALSRDVEKHSRRFDSVLKSALERIDQIAHSTMTTSSEDLARTAAVFSGLHSVIESMAISVTPIFNRIIETQEQLLTAVTSEASSGRLISTAASDISGAAQASRETVEKLVVLASALGESSRALGGLPWSDVKDPALAEELEKLTNGDVEPKGRGKLLKSKGLGRALSTLREETESTAKKLPEL